MLKKAFLFPGQGSQQVGMAQDFYNTYAIARECVEEADDILGESLSKIMFQGPIEKLTQTKYSQPAIFVASCAILNVFRQQHPKCIPTFCAGHSLGEFTALFAAEYLSFENALKLVQARANFMSEACLKASGTMAAILGIEAAKLEVLVEGKPVCVANYNCPGQIVISGETEAVIELMDKAKAEGAKKSIQLPVQGAFHSDLMLTAKEQFDSFVRGISLNESSSSKVVMNTLSKPCEDTDSMKQLMGEQMIRSVLWEQSLKYMDNQDVALFIELGAGKTLATLNKRMKLSGKTINISKPQDIEAFTL